MDGDIFKNQKTIGNFERLATHRAVSDQRSARAEGIRQIESAGSADRVEPELRKHAAAERERFRSQVLVLGHHDIRPHATQLGHQLGPSNDIQRAETECLGQLNHRAPDA